MFEDTKLTRVGTNEDGFGIINPPVYRASTIHFPTIDAFDRRFDGRYDGIVYGSYGTPTTKALESAIAELENANRALVLSSGTAAITLTFMACVRPGDHVLLADCAYKSTRALCETLLRRLGVETSCFRPDAGADIEAAIRPETRLVFLESPGSYTFEMQDIPAITAVCRRRGVLTAIDNTWASPLFFRPLDHGVDISTQAATKYLCGHSDVMLGSIAVNDEELFRTLKDTAIQFGNSVSPADCYLALRGMRTMGVRLRQHQATALRLIEWLSGRLEVERCLYPAWPDDPGHAIWKRDFQGASGLFGVVLRPAGREAVAALVDGMRYFRIGASWGGYESLMIPAYPTRDFAEPPWSERGPLLRLHAGLEDPRDLIADLEEGFARFRSAAEAEAQVPRRG